MSWEKGMLDNSVNPCFRARKESTRPFVVSSSLSPLTPSPIKPPALSPQPNSLKSIATVAISNPSLIGTKKQPKAGRPMTIDESYDQVEKLLEQHRQQRKEHKPHRTAITIASEPSSLSRRTFVFAPLADVRMLSEIAVQEATDARENLLQHSQLDMEIGGSSPKLKYFGPEARTCYYQKYRELHRKPHLFVDLNTHESHHRASLRNNSSVLGHRRSTMRRSLPTLNQTQLSGGDLSLISSVPRSPRTLFLGTCLAESQTAPTLLLRKEYNQRVFDFSHQGLGDNFIVRFAACLPELPLVESINVCDNRLTDVGIRCLLRALENKPQLTSLDVSLNPIGVEAANVLRSYIRSNLCTLRVLTLNEVSLSDDECKRVAKALEHNKSIDQLLLRGNRIGLQTFVSVGKQLIDQDEEEDEEENKPVKLLTASEALGVMLTANLTLQHLDLSWNHLRAVGCGVLAAALPMNYQLRELNLSYNSLKDNGALSLAHALRAGARLRRLTLSYNGISARGGVGLASGLAVNASLLMLILDGNPLGVQGGKALLHASCAPRSTSAVCQLSLLECSLNVSTATDKEQLQVFNPADPAGSYVLTLSDAYEHMVAHELVRLAVSYPSRYHFATLEYLTGQGQVTKLEMVTCCLKPSSTSVEASFDNHKNLRLLDTVLNPVTMLFQRLDGDDSGSVELSELVNALRNCGLDVSDQQLAELLEKYDYDKSGALYKREFADLFARLGFALVDVDSSGSLDSDELGRVFQLLGVTERAEIDDAIARMIAKYDLDGSGEIDASEFLEFMTSEVLTDVEAKNDREAEMMTLELYEAVSGTVWHIPDTGQLTAEFVHIGGTVDMDDSFHQASDNLGDKTHRTDAELMPISMFSSLLVNASSISRNLTEQTEFLYSVLAESRMYLSSFQGEQLLTRQGVASSTVRAGKRLTALAKLLPWIIDHREATSLVTRILDIHNQWLERLALRRWLKSPLYSLLLGSLTNAYSFDLTRDDHRVALRRLALIAHEEKQFSRWRSGRGDTSQSGNWENFRWATLDSEPVLLSSTYILNKLLGPPQDEHTVSSLLSRPSKLVFYYVSTTRPPRGTKPLSQRRFEQLLAVLASPPSDNEISKLCGDCHDQEQDVQTFNDKKTQALGHWEYLRCYVMTQTDKQHRRRSVADEKMSRLTNTVEELQQKLLLLEILVADRWLSCVQAQELINTLPNAVRARARAACLAFSRIIDLENFIQIYDGLSLEDQEECVRRLGWLNILDPMQPDRQYPILDLSIHDERELVQMLAQLALQEHTCCWQNASYCPSILSSGGDHVAAEATDGLPPPGWGRPDAVGPDSVKHHGTVCLRYHSERGSTSDDTMPQEETDERDAERCILRDRVLCGSRLFL